MRSIRTHGAILLVTAVLLPVARADAQVEPGRRVRIRAVGQRLIVGKLLAMDDAALTVRPDGATDGVTVVRSRISRIEESRHPSRKGRGAVIGAATGALLGALIGASMPSDCSRGDLFCIFPREDRGRFAAGGAVVFGLLGVAVGGLVAPGEKWEGIPLDSLHVGLAPTRHHGLAVALSFGI